MSPPDTNTEKQKRRHKGPLMGLAGVITWALVLLALLAIYVVFRGNEPADQEPIGVETDTQETINPPVREEEVE
ncbi:hypothetical protein [Palleronia sp.]|uniref:hypothetical protein n=1 Tax=Palleronia sp. TaxID=1940284 RepID=UPI0035C80D5F